MEEAYAGSCVQSFFEPKVDFSICTNKSIKLFLKDLNNLNYPRNVIDNSNENNLNNSNNKNEQNNNDNKNQENKSISKDDDKNILNIDNKDALNSNNGEETNNDNNICTIEENINKILEENVSLLNGYSYFSRIGHNINLLHTELSSIKKDFLFLSKQTRVKVKKLKNIKKKNIIYKGLLEEVKEDRKRKELYEKLSIEIKKLDDVRKVQKKQKAEKYSIENFEKKIKNIESTISSNNNNVLKTIEQINEIISTNLQIDIK
ncbi:conserved Plasmodium protein, unknown function [Plasmodium relictum]|uniref:Uncharacterized protein n=1 Tax=Plasmodium relictum TaxID=85471 RepID=A0A1J1H7T8_PLARL|nr:conserved Plasmodium protein, unknown function [Plasmodium relictum]CRH00970.1 conserved Plasmodium protein, unknown function [Plasmodium relictum]